MNDDLDKLLPDVVMRSPYPATEVDELIADFVGEVGPIPHHDYLEFIRRHAGGDGPVGSNSYITIWPLEEVISGTEETGAPELAPGLLLFAGDGGDTAYAFDRQDPKWPIVSVPLVGLSRKELKFVAPTFSEFIKRLAADELPI